MFRKQELKNYLQEISQDARLLKFSFTSEEKFVIEMRCKVEENMTLEYYSRYISEWILKFSKFTSTSWIVRQSYPKLQRLLYRKTYTCARSSFNKKTASDSGMRNQACQAKIDFKFKKINRNTIRNDPLLREKLNLCIRIDFIHSHKVSGQEAFKYLKSETETDGIFYDYIKNGYTPKMAKSYHELYLLSKHGEKLEMIASRAVNPTLAHIFYLFNKAKIDGKKVLNFEEIMKGKKEIIEENEGLLYYPSESTIVVITPCMKRALAVLKFDVVLISSTALSQDTVVTLCFVPSKLGAICFACILHKEQTETTYSQAFFALKLTMENDCCKVFEPKIITVDNLTEKILALEAIYSGSRVMISPWSMCNRIWRWLCDDENKIDKRRRHELMAAFHDMLHAADLDTAQKYFNKLKNDVYVLSAPTLKDYVNTLWKTQIWRPGKRNLLIELSITIFNEFIKTTCKSFNMISMVDVVINIMDKHLCQILWSCLNNKDVVKTYTKFLEKSEGVCLGVDVTNVGPNEYKIDRKGEQSKWKIRFRTDTLCCECALGVKGHFCVHLCAIVNTPNIALEVPHITESEKSIFLQIAGDIDECDSKDPIDEPNIEENTQVENFEEDSFNIIDEQFDISPKQEVNGDYYYLEVKKEDNNDPLTTYNEEMEVCNSSMSMVQSNNFKEQYEEAVKSVNGEFRRLNKYFKENPNVSNLDTMLRLARELGKIRPVERVNLNNMVIELNSGAKLV